MHVDLVPCHHPCVQIRTASVTTTPDGHVRDMFEVRVDNNNLTPEEIQNMVHDALFQPYALPSDTEHQGKRPRLPAWAVWYFWCYST